MRILTFNLWHGLSPQSLVAFESLEPTARRELREQLQEQVLREADPDVSFFQEVNPVHERVERLSQSLQRTAVVQPDLVGLKLFGLGFPLNLNSGLVTMARPQLGLKKVAGLSLSRPGVNLVHSWGSWQLSEERFALLAETLVPEVGRVLLVNTHIHHGLEVTADFMAAVEALAEELDLSDVLMSELKARLLKGNQRRDQEMAVLLGQLRELQGRYNMIILGGDLNASPESSVAQALREAQFVDAWAAAHPNAPGHSFDHTHNEANHILQNRFPLSLVLEDLTFDPKVKERLLALARGQEMRPRRIDYVWVWRADGPLHVESCKLIGDPNDEGLAPSDHFGVLVQLCLTKDKGAAE